MGHTLGTRGDRILVPCADRRVMVDAGHRSVIAVCVHAKSCELAPRAVRISPDLGGPSLQSHADFPSDTDHKQWTVAAVFMDGVSAVISFDVVISEGCMEGITERMLYE